MNGHEKQSRGELTDAVVAHGTANLLLAFADMANAEVEQIGHSTGRLSL